MKIKFSGEIHVTGRNLPGFRGDGSMFADSEFIDQFFKNLGIELRNSYKIMQNENIKEHICNFSTRAGKSRIELKKTNKLETLEES